VGTAVKADLDFAIRYGDVGGNVDQIAKDLAGLSIGIAAHLEVKEPDPYFASAVNVGPS
jgi:hypothetical protein